MIEVHFIFHAVLIFDFIALTWKWWLTTDNLITFRQHDYYVLAKLEIELLICILICVIFSDKVSYNLLGGSHIYLIDTFFGINTNELYNEESCFFYLSRSRLVSERYMKKDYFFLHYEIAWLVSDRLLLKLF